LTGSNQLLQITQLTGKTHAYLLITTVSPNVLISHCLSALMLLGSTWQVDPG
jgi:hypothetical protein